MIRRLLFVVLALALAGLSWRSLFSVDATQIAVRTRFGRIVGVDGPGLHGKSPLEEVREFDRRLITRVYPGETFPTADQRALSVDFLLRWRVEDPERFLRAIGGDEDVAARRLSDLARAQIRAALARSPLAAAIAAPRAGIGAAQLQSIDAAAADLGVHVVDLQLQRMDPSAAAAQAVYQRMQQSLAAQAASLHEAALTDVEKVRTDAERRQAEVLADATRESQRIRGEADAKAAAAYAQVYARNPDFANFYRSLQAYRQTIGQAGDVLVIAPEGEFFKYLHGVGGR